EVDVIDLLHRAAGKAGLMLDEVLQIGLGSDRIVAMHRLVPGPVRARPHRMNAGKTADIAGDDPAGREQEARQPDDAAEPGLCGIVGSAPRGIVAADAMGVVADVVARRLIAPRLRRVFDGLAEPFAQMIQASLGDLWKAPFVLQCHPWVSGYSSL